MAAYTFFLWKSQQRAIPPFTIEVLDTNGSATACASIMLSRWTEYDYVEIICDGEAIATVHREGSPSNAIVVPRVWPVRGSAPLQ